jgi:hypothetical protein
MGMNTEFLRKPPPRVYHISRPLHRLITDLVGPDPELAGHGATITYTRNHALAAFVLAHGYTVQWTEKPTDSPTSVKLRDETLTPLVGQPIARVEADPDSKLGTIVVWSKEDDSN